MAETFEVHCKVDKIYQVLLESLNPCIRDVIGTAKSYLKATQHLSTVTQDYVSALEKLSNVALCSNAAVETIGRCFKEIIQLLLHTEDRKASMIEFISSSLLVPLEKHLDQDQKLLIESRKKYKKLHKAQVVELEEAQKQLQTVRKRIVSRKDKPNYKGIAAVLADEEHEAAERVKQLRSSVDGHRVNGLKQALVEERKRCAFLLDCQIDVMTMQAGVCKETHSLIQQSLDSWKSASKHPEILPPEALQLMNEFGIKGTMTDHRKPLATSEQILHRSESKESMDCSPSSGKQNRLHWENSDLDQHTWLQQHSPRTQYSQKQHGVHRVQSASRTGGEDPGKRHRGELPRNSIDKIPVGGSQTQTLPRKVCSIAPFNIEYDRESSDHADPADDHSASAFYSTFYGAETPFTPNLSHRSFNACASPATSLTNSLPITLRKDSLFNQPALKPAQSVQTQSQATVASGLLAQARHSYNPFHQRGQLEFLSGDLVQILQAGTNGWKYGINLRTNKYGWFPSSYVKSMLERKTSGFKPNSESSASKPKLPESLTTSFTLESDTSTAYVQRQHSQHNLTSHQLSFKPFPGLLVERVGPSENSIYPSSSSCNQRPSLHPQPLDAGTTPQLARPHNHSFSGSTLASFPSPKLLRDKAPSMAVPVMPSELLGERSGNLSKVVGTTNGCAFKAGGDTSPNPFAHVKLRPVKNGQGELRKYI